MALSAFEDRDTRPGEGALKAMLGKSSRVWFSLVEHFAERYAPTAQEWAFAGAKYGWSLRLLHKKRRILYLIPQKGHFLVGVVLGEKAVASANASSLPRAVLDAMNDAPKYAEGRGIRLKVGSPGDLEMVKTLAALKVAN